MTTQSVAASSYKLIDAIRTAILTASNDAVWDGTDSQLIATANEMLGRLAGMDDWLYEQTGVLPAGVPAEA